MAATGWLCWFADVAGSEVLLPTLSVEDTDGQQDGADDSSGQGSRRPSKLTLDPGDETTSQLIASNVSETATLAVQQLEPEVSDTQLAEVESLRTCLC